MVPALPGCLTWSACQRTCQAPGSTRAGRQAFDQDDLMAAHLAAGFAYPVANRRPSLVAPFLGGQDLNHGALQTPQYRSRSLTAIIAVRTAVIVNATTWSSFAPIVPRPPVPGRPGPTGVSVETKTLHERP
jgi:hypothetical protein